MAANVSQILISVVWIALAAAGLACIWGLIRIGRLCTTMRALQPKFMVSLIRNINERSSKGDFREDDVLDHEKNMEMLASVRDYIRQTPEMVVDAQERGVGGATEGINRVFRVETDIRFWSSLLGTLIQTLPYLGILGTIFSMAAVTAATDGGTMESLLGNFKDALWTTAVGLFGAVIVSVLRSALLFRGIESAYNKAGVYRETELLIRRWWQEKLTREGDGAQK